MPPCLHKRTMASRHKGLLPPGLQGGLRCTLVSMESPVPAAGAGGSRPTPRALCLLSMALDPVAFAELPGFVEVALAVCGTRPALRGSGSAGAGLGAPLAAPGHLWAWLTLTRVARELGESSSGIPAGPPRPSRAPAAVSRWAAGRLGSCPVFAIPLPLDKQPLKAGPGLSPHVACGLPDASNLAAFPSCCRRRSQRK